MSIRKNRIISEILENPELEIADIAKEFGVSKRSIRNDIHDINDFLTENHLENIEIKSDKIVCYDVNSLKQYLKIIRLQGFDDYKLSKEERVQIIIEDLISTDDYINISDLANKMFVSNSTISGDLKKVSKIINQYHLSYISEPYIGIKLEGDEINKRILLVDIIGEQFKFPTCNDIDNVPNEDVIDKFNQVISHFESHSNMLMTDESYSKFNRYLYVMIQRIRQGVVLKDNYQEINKIFMNKAKEISKLIQKNFELDVSETETNMMSQFLSSLKYINKDVFSENIIKIQFFVNRLVDQLKMILKIDLSDDYLFFDKLCIHIDYMTKNVISSSAYDDVIRQVTEEHKDIRDAVVDSVYILEELLNRKITDSEIDYILLHICTAIERKKISESSVKTVLVSDLGIASTQFLIGKIKSNFDFPIIDIVPAHAIKHFDQSNIDLIISTVSLDKKLLKVPYVTIDFNFKDKDYSVVNRMIKSIKRNKLEDTDRASLFKKDLKKVLSKYNINDENKLYSDILNVLKKNGAMDIAETSESEEEYKLSELLLEDQIYLDVDADNWKDSVYKASLPLLNKGFIEPRYVDAMISRIENDTPYMIITPGFIVPHGGVDDGGLKPGFSLVKYRNPIDFGADSGKIEFVCCLSVIDLKKHLKAFFSLVEFVQDKQYYQRLKNSKKSHEIYELILEFERR